MRILFAALWLLIPLGLAAYHFGPGQEQVKLDDTEALRSRAREGVAQEDWEGAPKYYQDALTKLPKEQTEISLRIQLEIAKAKMQNSGLPEARDNPLRGPRHPPPTPAVRVPSTNPRESRFVAAMAISVFRES